MSRKKNTLTTPLKSDDYTCPVYQYALVEYKKNLNHPQVDLEEFQDAYNRFWFVIKLLVIYKNKSELNTRLLVNHLIILVNNFGIGASKILLKIVLEKGDYEVISYALTILDFIGFIPENRLIDIMGEEYLLTEIPINRNLLTYIQEDIENDRS